MKRFLREQGKWLAAIAVLAVAAVISGGYILVNQRLSIPFNDRYTIQADLSSASGLAPGLGQAVNVAGVRVGQISGSRIVGGRARISMEIDPKKLPKVYEDAKAELVADTPLKDLVLELGPGRPPAKPLPDGGLIPVVNTSPPVDSDELTNALDADTRDFFDLLVADLSSGTEGRGADMNRLLRALGPTAEQTREITGALAERRRELRRLVGNLAILTKAAATKDGEIASVVETANATLQAVAGQEGNLRATLDRLPGTLSSVSDSLIEVREFSDELGPTLDRLLPSVERLPTALRQLTPLLDTAEPVLRTKLRPLVRELTPLARDAAPSVRRLIAGSPDLTAAFQVLNYTVNSLAFNPEGSDEGYLYWLAWFLHNANSVGSVQDAHGPVTRGLALFSCDSLTGDVSLAPVLALLLTDLPVCPG